MSNGELSTKAQSVQQALEGLGLELDVVELPDSTRSAKEAASAIGCTVAQIAKSLIFESMETHRPVLVIASGVNRVDEKRIGDMLGELIGKASADFVRRQTGFSIGGVPPVGHIQQPTTYLDQDLLQYDEIWAAAGTPHAVFRLTPQQLIEATGGKVMQVA